MKFVTVEFCNAIIRYNPDISFFTLQNLITFGAWKALINRKIPERRFLGKNTKNNEEKWQYQPLMSEAHCLRQCNEEFMHQ
jgi:hypothetical protein